MDWKKFFITFIVLYIVGNLLQFIVHMLLLGSIYQELAHVWRQDMDSYMWVMYVTAAFYCFFFVYIFAKGREDKGILEGVKYGLVIWGFYTIPSIYGQFMVYPLPYRLIMYWLFSDLVVLIILGVITALLYKPAVKKKV